MKTHPTLSVLLSLLVGCAEPLPEQPDPLDFSPDAAVFDFGTAGDTSWFSVNDTVMGGVSTGELSYTPDSLVFEGTVSTDSNGGFTSIRSPSEVSDLSMYDRVVVRLRSEGQPFTMGLAHRPSWFQGQFRSDLEPGTGDWQVVELDLDAFELVDFNGGYPEPTGQTMVADNREEIYYVELQSELFEDGAFRLEVDLPAFDVAQEPIE